MQRLLHILLWSVLSAAFIGPGTVTTAAGSGARFGFSLLWALLFSTIACLVLQEASARVTVVTGKSLAGAIRFRFRRGAGGTAAVVLVSGAIFAGCAAYEAGNILGGVAGVSLGFDLPARPVTLAVGIAAGLMLFFGTTTAVARLLGGVVALMGVTFLATAVRAAPSPAELLRGLFVPALPSGSGLLVLGLIGTTVVPYNLFLGSGIAAGQRLRDVRFGLTVAILLGGLISMGVLVVGTLVPVPFDFESLAAALAGRLGGWAAAFFALGLFAAGLSSAVTAPLAAAITARGLFGGTGGWGDRSWRYRAVWSFVLATGVGFGLAGVKPVPAIVIAQALNGILLPFVAVFLFLVVNDSRLMGRDGINGGRANAVTAIVVAVTVLLGLNKLTAAAVSALHLPPTPPIVLPAVSGAITLALALPVARAVRRGRRPQPAGTGDPPVTP